MKRIMFILAPIFFSPFAQSQDLKFENPSPYTVKEEKQDKTISILFTLEKATKDCDVLIAIDDKKSSAKKDKDYTLSSKDTIHLNKDNKYSGKVDLIIKSNDSLKTEEDIYLKLKYKDESKKSKEVEYVVKIESANGENPGGTAKTEDGKRNRFSAYFILGTIRLNSNSTKTIDTALHIVIPAGQSLKNGKIIIKQRDDLTSKGYTNKIKVPLSNEFKIGDLRDTTIFSYELFLIRDSADDKSVGFELKAFDSSGHQIALNSGDTAVIIYVKPVVSSPLTTNNSWEFWMFTGTNFDPFEGIKAQEFFFRANTIARLSKRFYAQLGIYKNRYFVADSIQSQALYQRSSPFNVLIPPDTTTTYRFDSGSYQRNVSQKIDPVGIQFDVMFKLNNSDTIKNTSNFFGTLGFDISTKTVTTQYSNSKFDTVVTQSKLPRGDAPEINLLKANAVTFHVPVYNINIGFMWILDEEEVNIKAQFNGGISKFFTAYVARGGIIETFKTKPYLQFRMFATAKKTGISFGFESFIRKQEYPQFNFTLSKVFDLRNFLNVLTPVNSLNLK